MVNTMDITSNGGIIWKFDKYDYEFNCKTYCWVDIISNFVYRLTIQSSSTILYVCKDREVISAELFDNTEAALNEMDKLIFPEI